MRDFTSTALKRTFPVVFFGTLEGGQPAFGLAPLGGTRAPLGPVAVKGLERAAGPTGKTVAELIGHRIELAGKMVRVHATVVKSTPGVLGRTYLHLRDGSGDPSAGTHDVAATTGTTPAVGDTILLEGVVVIDRDLGAGYKFPTIVEDATVVAPQ
jgi:hypothetical protein